MDIKKIIYATDFSEYCLPALEYASTLAAAEKARLLIVHVDDETPGLVPGDVGYGYLPQIDRIAHEQIEQLMKIWPTRKEVVCEHQLLRGDAAEQIVSFAQKQEADLIVIGSHGVSGLRRVLLGSVAEEIVRKAICPVLTVKIPDLQASRKDNIQESVAET